MPGLLAASNKAAEANLVEVAREVPAFLEAAQHAMVSAGLLRMSWLGWLM